MDGQDCARACTPENSTQKRARSSPTLQTPHREPKRIPLRQQDQNRNSLSPRVLSQTFRNRSNHIHNPKPKERWTDSELRALTDFVLFHCEGNAWPAHKREDFWGSASEFVQARSGLSTCRTAQACRFQVVGGLSKKYKTPKEAEADFCGQDSTARVTPVNEPMRSAQNSPAPDTGNENPPTFADLFSSLPEDTQLQTLSGLFSSYLLSCHDLQVPDDFLCHSANAMLQLRLNKCTNVLYNLAKGMGTLREDNTDSKFPMKRMPMGLVEYAASFFACDDLREVIFCKEIRLLISFHTQISCPPDYRSWQQSMYCQFGQKWTKLLRGPMWSVVFSGQSSEEAENNSHSQSTMKALVNIPALSDRTMRRDIESSNIHLNSQIQISVLDEAARSSPEAWWWLKADGCDITKGLKESVKQQWSGDVDLNDGCLQQQFKGYKQRLEEADKVGLQKDRAGEDLDRTLQDLVKDLDFIYSELKQSNDTYSEKLQSNKYIEKDLINLSWKIKELGDLNEMGRSLHTEVNLLYSRLEAGQCFWEQENIPRLLTDIRKKLRSFIKGITRHQRTAATHILVFMISQEMRRTKPYAIPVQCIPYKGLSDLKVRELSNRIIEEMTKRKMKVAGFTTDGEWNSLRSKGNTRPLSVFQVLSDARRKYSRTGLQTMIGMLSPLCNADGVVTARVHNDAVHTDLLNQIHGWITAGAKQDDAIERLRLKTVPTGYNVHTWIQGKDETQVDKLRSILAQLEYKHQIDMWHSKGIPFKDYLYVPEVHPITGLQFCEREDEAHILKRIGHSLRTGGHADIELERFQEALHDSSAGLTYTALSGVRKQSVEDVERLFSKSLVKWMEEKEYNAEAQHLRIVCNWRRACDERGLTRVQRSEFNNDFLNYLLDDLMPWHKEEKLRDFSLLEVNRSIAGVRGFSRETIIALAANIESREWRCKYLAANNEPPEHPRASTTDDVECFFSVLRDSVGKDFTLKEVQFGWRRVVHEFAKRLDPELPFYYYTSSRSRFYEGEMPDFDTKGNKSSKPKRIPQYELLGSNNRVTLSVRKSTSIRTSFHNLPVKLPPPPGTVYQLTDEHSYSIHKK
ncbi:uncharacterized protein [Dysidea avara]|uniref:uncharacterized protein isoform X1 n=1 Tax=Dysidea avara TaxID=196820 RepID=UPI00331C647D